MGEKYPIKSEVVGLREVLKLQYNIPAYQRPYEWDEKNIDDFLSSIFDGFREKIKNELDSKPVFFGTIQLNKENESGETFDIVDGQQRLTTFLLFLDVLSKHCEGGLNYGIEIDKVIKCEELEKFFKISVEQFDNSYYSTRYIENKKMLDKKTKSNFEDEVFNNISDVYSDLIEYIMDNVYFVRLDTEEMELSDVVSVFNTINTTGLDLNASDVFKFRYYDYLKSLDNNRDWMNEINSCYKYIDLSNEKCGENERTDQSVLNMSWILDVYKHIICAQFGWGFSEVSKSNQKFFDDLFKRKSYKGQQDISVLQFDSFKRLVKGFVGFWRWIEDTRYGNNQKEYAYELFSECLVEKTRYSRYWTIPFMVAFFKTKDSDWSKFYIDSLRINLHMFKFFTVYSVINDRVINAVQNKVCGECFKWFKDYSIEDIIRNINGLLWSSVRWENDNPEKWFYDIIEKGLFNNGSRAHLICTLLALIDEIKNLGETIITPRGKSIDITEKTIQERLFNWNNNPYDIEHILAQNIFKDYEGDLEIFNGIGNLVVLDRSINRDIKDIPVNEKLNKYKESKYVSVKKIYEDDRNNDWDIKTVEERKQNEIIKLKEFMAS